MYSEEEMKKKENRRNANILVFLVSAFWHGFYPSYYIVFLHFPLGTIIEEKLQTVFKNFTFSSRVHTAYMYIMQFSKFFAFSFCLGLMDCLDIKEMFRFMTKMRFSFSIYLVCQFLIVMAVIELGNFKVKNENKGKISGEVEIKNEKLAAKNIQ